MARYSRDALATKMAGDTACVWVVDDDPLVRRTLATSLRHAGYRTESCATAQSLLDTWSDGNPNCLIVDLELPDMDGISLQQELKLRGCSSPVIFISGHGTIPATVAALKQGALDFLEKPFSRDALLARVEQAIAEDESRRALAAQRRSTRQRLALLTAREREILSLMTRGLSNKQMALELDISPRTVENHRAQVMKKMAADNLVNLCAMTSSELESLQDPMSPPQETEQG